MSSTAATALHHLDDEHAGPEFSLTRGGPTYRILRRLGIVRGDDRDALRQWLACIAVTCVPLWPLLIWDRATSTSFTSWELLAFHARFFVALPMLFAAERLLEYRCRAAMHRFTSGDFADASAGVARIMGVAERLRDSGRAELILLAIMVVNRLAVVNVTGHLTVLQRNDTAHGLSLAVVWFALVCLPLFNFLLARWLWRWLIWAVLLWRLARLHLRLMATHPDHAGGIAFLAHPTHAMATLLCGLTGLLAVSWAHDRMTGHLPDGMLLVHATVLVLFGAILALGPLLPFTPDLLKARFDAMYQYSGFALSYTRAFHNRWIDGKPREEVLGSADIQSLNDLIGSVESIQSMRVTAFGREHVIVLVAAILLPLVPVPLITANLSLQQLLQRLAGVVFAGFL